MKDFRKIKNNLIHKTAIINWSKVNIGKNNVIGPYAVIGSDAQHPYDKSLGKIFIGNNNIIREFTTVHLPTRVRKKTIIGNKCYLMTLSHIAHDCIIEDGVIIANNVTLGGNSYVMKQAQIGFSSTIHQGQVIGSFSMIGMSSVITKNLKVLPGFVFAGNPAKKIKLNKIGIIKKKISSESLKNENLRFKNIIKKQND